MQDNAAFVKAKINNAGILCLGYTQALRPGVKGELLGAHDLSKANVQSLGVSLLTLPDSTTVSLSLLLQK
jgi:hypothetical protein